MQKSETRGRFRVSSLAESPKAEKKKKPTARSPRNSVSSPSQKWKAKSFADKGSAGSDGANTMAERAPQERGSQRQMPSSMRASSRRAGATGSMRVSPGYLHRMAAGNPNQSGSFAPGVLRVLQQERGMVDEVFLDPELGRAGSHAGSSRWRRSGGNLMSQMSSSSSRSFDDRAPRRSGPLRASLAKEGKGGLDIFRKSSSIRSSKDANCVKKDSGA